MRRYSFVRELGSRTVFAADNGDDDEDENEDEEEEHEGEEDEEEEEEPLWSGALGPINGACVRVTLGAGRSG